MKNIFFITIIFISFTFLNAAKLNKELVQLARCSAIIKANSYIDYASGNITRDEMLNSLTLSNSLYMNSIFEMKPKLSKDAILQYDSLSASTLDQFVNFANTDNWDTEQYEQVISCYKKYSLELYNLSTFDKKKKFFIDKVSKENLHNIDAILDK